MKTSPATPMARGSTWLDDVDRDGIEGEGSGPPFFRKKRRLSRR